EVPIRGHAQDLEAFGLDRLRERTDAEPGGVLGAEIFVDDDDGEAEFHLALPAARRLERRTDGANRNSTERAMMLDIDPQVTCEFGCREMGAPAQRRNAPGPAPDDSRS